MGRRYCVGVLTPALHNVMETSCSEDSEFSLKGLVKGFNAYKAVSTARLRLVAPNMYRYRLLRPPVASLACAQCLQRVHQCPHVPGIADALTQMNRLIAESVAVIHSPGDIVWAHGYELIVLSKEIRALTRNPRVVRRAVIFFQSMQCCEGSNHACLCALVSDTPLCVSACVSACACACVLSTYWSCGY